MPAVKVHLANSADPLKEHSDLVSVCGVPVPAALFLRMWDAKKMPAAESEEWRGVCRKCVAKELPEDRVYIIVDGNEARQKWQELKHGEGT